MNVSGRSRIHRLTWMRCGLAVAAVWISWGTAHAQQGLPRSPESPENLAPFEVVRLFDAYTIVQAQEMLQLSEPQYAQFITRLKALQEVRRRHQRDRNQIMQDLVRLSQQKPAAEETPIRETLKALKALEDRSSLDERKAYEAIDQVLDVRQQGRFRVFEEQIERRKLELLGRARAARRPVVRRPPS